MDKKDKIDDLIMKFSKEIIDEVTPLRSECLNEDLLWKYSRSELTEEEKELIEEHLVSCDECLEALEYMRMAQQAEEEPMEVPEKLYRSAKEILQKGSGKSSPAKFSPGKYSPAKPYSPAKERAIPPTPSKDRVTPLGPITLIWDKVHNKITHLWGELEGMITFQGPVLQPVRDSDRAFEQNSDQNSVQKQDKTPAQNIQLQGKASGFPYCIPVETELGPLSIEIDRAESEEYLTMSVSSRCPKKIPAHIQVCLYKAETGMKKADMEKTEAEKTWVKRVESSFTDFRDIRLKRDTDYRLELFDKESSIVIIDLPVVTGQLL